MALIFSVFFSLSVFAESTSLGWKIHDGKVSYDGKVILSKSSDDFKIMNSKGYALTDKKVYFQGKEIKGVDRATFTVGNKPWLAQDEFIFYYKGQQFKARNFPPKILKKFESLFSKNFKKRLKAANQLAKVDPVFSNLFNYSDTNNNKYWSCQKNCSSYFKAAYHSISILKSIATRYCESPATDFIWFLMNQEENKNFLLSSEEDIQKLKAYLKDSYKELMEPNKNLRLAEIKKNSCFKKRGNRYEFQRCHQHNVTKHCSYGVYEFLKDKKTYERVNLKRPPSLPL